MRIIGVIALSVGIVGFALPRHAVAQNSAAATGPSITSTAVPSPAVVEEADQLLKQMGAYLGSAEQFTFRADVTFDHVLPSGQKLHFLATENVALRRPNGLYVEWNSDLG